VPDGNDGERHYSRISSLQTQKVAAEVLRRRREDTPIIQWAETDIRICLPSPKVGTDGLRHLRGLPPGSRRLRSIKSAADMATVSKRLGVDFPRSSSKMGCRSANKTGCWRVDDVLVATARQARIHRHSKTPAAETRRKRMRGFASPSGRIIRQIGTISRCNANALAPIHVGISGTSAEPSVSSTMDAFQRGVLPLPSGSRSDWDSVESPHTRSCESWLNVRNPRA